MMNIETTVARQTLMRQRASRSASISLCSAREYIGVMATLSRLWKAAKGLRAYFRNERAMSLHFDILSQISGDVEIFAFDDCWLAFFKSSAGDRLELQNFLFRLRRLFGWCFFFLVRDRLPLRRTYERGWFAWHECRRGCRFGRHRFFKRNIFLRSHGFHRSWFWFDLNLWRGMLVLLLRWWRSGF